MEVGDISRASKDLDKLGYAVITGIAANDVDEARQSVLDRLDLLKNTRCNPSAGHLAGFHRYPELESLHRLVSSHEGALKVIQSATGRQRIRSIGLSDITVNRSQPWHVDLLRGAYRHYLSPEICWGPAGGGVYKVLLYLQPGASLHVMAGAHKKAIPLDDDRAARPSTLEEEHAVRVQAGDLVLMDVRLPHCGSSEEELAGDAILKDPKILVSTVLVGNDMPLGIAMERGNLERLLDWDRKHGASPPPRLDVATVMEGVGR
jgi:hypothetical protein